MTDHPRSDSLSPYEESLRLLVPPTLHDEVRESLELAGRPVPEDAGARRREVEDQLRSALVRRGMLTSPLNVETLSHGIEAVLGQGEDRLALYGTVGVSQPVVVPRVTVVTGAAIGAMLHGVVEEVLESGGASDAMVLVEALCASRPRVAAPLRVDDWVRLARAVLGSELVSRDEKTLRDACVALAWVRLRLSRPLTCPHGRFAPSAEAEVLACLEVGRGLDLGSGDPPWECGPGWRKAQHAAVQRQLEDAFGKATGAHASASNRAKQAEQFLALSLRRWAPWSDLGQGEPVQLAGQGRVLRYVAAPDADATVPRPVHCEVFPEPGSGAQGPAAVAKLQRDVARRYGAAPLCEPAWWLLWGEDGTTQLPSAEELLSRRLQHLAVRYSSRPSLHVASKWGLNNRELAVLRLLASSSAQPLSVHLKRVLENGGIGSVRSNAVSSDSGVTPGTAPAQGDDEGIAALEVRAEQWVSLLLPPEASKPAEWIHPERAFFLLVAQWASLQQGQAGRSTVGSSEAVDAAEVREVSDRALLAAMPDDLYEVLFKDPLREERVPRLKRLLKTIARSSEDVEAHVALRRVFEHDWQPREGDVQERIPGTLKSILQKAASEKRKFVDPLFGNEHPGGGAGVTADPQLLPTGMGKSELARWRSRVTDRAKRWADSAAQAGLADRQYHHRRIGQLERLIQAGMGWRARHFTQDVRLYAAMAAAYLDVVEAVDPEREQSWDAVAARIDEAPALPQLTDAQRATLSDTLVRLVESGLFTMWPATVREVADSIRQHGIDASRAALLGLMREVDLGGEDRGRLSRLRAMAREDARSYSAGGGRAPRGLTWLSWATRPMMLAPDERSLANAHPLDRAALIVCRAVDVRLEELQAEPFLGLDSATEEGRRGLALSEEAVLRMLLGADELSAAATLILARLEAASLSASVEARRSVDQLRAGLHQLIGRSADLAVRHYPDRHHLRELARSRLRPPLLLAGVGWSSLSDREPLSAPPHEADPMRELWRRFVVLDDLVVEPPRRGRPPTPPRWDVSAPRFFRVTAAAHRADDGLPELVPGGDRLGERIWLRRDRDGGAWLLTDDRRWRVHCGDVRARWRAVEPGLFALALSPGSWRLRLPRAAGHPALEVQLELGDTETAGT